MFALSEVECRPNANDPTKFLFVVPQKIDSNYQAAPTTGDDGTRVAAPSFYNHDRVLQVRKLFLFKNGPSLASF